MKAGVALVMLQQDGLWLMQLRDEIPTIVAPGCWELFGDHLEPGEAPEQALRRKLMEEISWQPPVMELVMVHHTQRRTGRVFRADLSVPMEQLQLLEGQNITLVSSDDLLAGTTWRNHLGCYRLLADGLADVTTKTGHFQYVRLLFDNTPLVAPLSLITPALLRRLDSHCLQGCNPIRRPPCNSCNTISSIQHLESCQDQGGGKHCGSLLSLKPPLGSLLWLSQP